MFTKKEKRLVGKGCFTIIRERGGILNFQIPVDNRSILLYNFRRMLLKGDAL